MFPDNFFAGLSGDSFSSIFETFLTGFLTIIVAPLAAMADILYRTFGGQ